MRFFKDGREARREKDAQWKRFWAWYPVRVSRDEWRWLESVETRIVWKYDPSPWGDWAGRVEYRAIGSTIGWASIED